eukprot:jgi/Ulvmu1/10030/UM059_0079.1
MPDGHSTQPAPAESGEEVSLYEDSVKLEEILSATLLDKIYNFWQSPSCNDQDDRTCTEMVELLATVFSCIPEAGPIMEMLATLSDATAADPPAKAAIAVVVSQMADSSAVAWVPSFGAALVAIDQTIPQARTVIHAICLDAWEQNTHR